METGRSAADAASGHSAEPETICVVSADTASVPNAIRKVLYPEVRHKYLKRSDAQLFAVMCEGGGLPTVLHQTFNGAAFQAARLAHENPGQRFHVLASQRVSFVTTDIAEYAEEIAA